MQKFYKSQTNVKSAINSLLKTPVKGIRFTYDEEIYNKIFDKLELKKVYLNKDGSPTNELNILDFNVRLSPLTYYLNKELKPKHHLIYADGQSAFKFWETAQLDENSDMINNHVLIEKVTTTVKANLLTKPLQLKFIEPKFLPESTNEENNDDKFKSINKTLLFVGDFVSATQAGSLRTCIYYNEVGTSMFRYGGVKFLVWTTPNEILKYLGPIGSIHRRTNALMANLYSDIKIIACSENLTNPKAQRLLGHMDYIELPKKDSTDEICLAEFQSNYNKYDIKFPSELHLIIHKLFCAPGSKLIEKLHVLGPGAEEYLKGKLDDEMLNKKISFLTNEDFIDLSEKYYYWPFKPNTNLETYCSSYLMDAE